MRSAKYVRLVGEVQCRSVDFVGVLADFRIALDVDVVSHHHLRRVLHVPVLWMAVRDVYVRVEERKNLSKHHVDVVHPSTYKDDLVLDVDWRRRVDVVVDATLHFLVLDFIMEIRDSVLRQLDARALDCDER